MERGADRRSIDRAARDRVGTIQLVGDSPELLAGIAESAREHDLAVRTDGTDGTDDQPASLVVTTFAVRRGESALRRSVAAVAELGDGLADGAVAIAIIRSGAARVVSERLVRKLAPELLYLVEHAVAGADAQVSWWTSLRLNTTRSSLRAAGLRILRFVP